MPLRTSILNKWAQQQSLRLRDCRVASFNWGPWAGGMVTDALKPMFEQEGLSLIPLDAGARLVVEEARRETSPGVELVVVAEPRPGALCLLVAPHRSRCARRPTADSESGSRPSFSATSIWSRSPSCRPT